MTARPNRTFPFVLLLPILAISACAPSVEMQPFIYAAPQEAVFNSVLKVISAAPVVPEYNIDCTFIEVRATCFPNGPWTITTSDKAHGLIHAEAQSKLVNGFGEDIGLRVTHTISATIIQNGGNTFVTVRASEYGEDLRDAIIAKLNVTYPHLQRFLQVPIHDAH